MNHIGCDIHIKTIDFAVVNERGIVSDRKKIATSERNILEFIQQVGKPRVVVIEEGTLANWIKDTVESRGEKVVITDPKQNRWIGQSSEKGDRLDAEKLARLHYGGYTKEIIRVSGEHRWFREMILYYHDQVRSRTRLKNKLKAKFRQNGVRCSGITVYQPENKKTWLEMLPQEKHLRWQVEGYMSQLYQLDQHIEETKKQIFQEAKQRAEIARLRKIEGIDWIISCTIVGIIGDMARFPDKKKLWKYGGLGLMERESGGKRLEHHLSRDYHRLLKWAFKNAALCAIRSKDNGFRRQYHGLTMEKGRLPHRALLTVARSMAATVYAVWKKGRDYDPNLRELRA